MTRRISRHKSDLFSDLLGLRNKAIHQPASVSEADFQMAIRKMELLEEVNI